MGEPSSNAARPPIALVSTRIVASKSSFFDSFLPNVFNPLVHRVQKKKNSQLGCKVVPLAELVFLGAHYSERLELMG